MNFLKSILLALWKPAAVILVIAVLAFLFIHYFLKPTPPVVTLPGGQVINLDTKSFNNSVNQINKKIDEQGKKVNDLESTIRQQQNTFVEKQIPAALKETSIARSVASMKEAW